MPEIADVRPLEAQTWSTDPSRSTGLNYQKSTPHKLNLRLFRWWGPLGPCLRCPRKLCKLYMMLLSSFRKQLSKEILSAFRHRDARNVAFKCLFDVSPNSTRRKFERVLSPKAHLARRRTRRRSWGVCLKHLERCRKGTRFPAPAGHGSLIVSARMGSIRSGIGWP